MEIIELKINNKTLQAFKTILPGNEDKGEMYLVKGDRGYGMCAIMHDERVNKSGAVAFIVPAYTLDESLNEKISFVTDQAKALGIKVGMLGKEGYERLCSF